MHHLSLDPSERGNTATYLFSRKGLFIPVRQTSRHDKMLKPPRNVSARTTNLRNATAVPLLTAPSNLRAGDPICAIHIRPITHGVLTMYRRPEVFLRS